MTFSFFAIIMILIVLLAAFIHALQGFFSATLSAILAVFAAVLALSYHETIVEKYLGGAVADSAHAMVLVVLFATIYFVLRVVFDLAIPGNIRLPAAADKVGGAVMGAIAGIFAAGVIAVAAQEMSFFPALAGYSRYTVDDHDVRLPTSGRTQDMTVKDQMASPTFDDAESAGEKQKLLLPVDDILVGMTNRLSSIGSLTDGKPLTTVHPDWLQEIFAQRLGMQPGAKHVLLGLPNGKTPDATVDHLYLVGQPGPTNLCCIDGEYNDLRGSAKQKIPPINKADGHPDYVVKPNHYLIVARIRFDLQAGDKLGGGLVRMGPANVRLVAPGISNTTGEPVDHIDYYPIGTLQYKGLYVSVMSSNTVAPNLSKPVLMLQNADDFLFIKKDDTPPDSAAPGSDLNAGADFVFSVDKNALEKTVTKGGAPESGLQMKDGSFIEVKRLVRDDVGGQKLLPESALQTGKDSIAIIRRDKLLHDELAQIKPPMYVDPSAIATASTPATPAPTAKPTPAEPPKSAEAPFPLEIADAPKPYDRFYTSVTSDRDSGPAMTIKWDDGAKAEMTVDNKQIQSLSIDGATSEDMHGKTEKQFITLATPSNMVLVQVNGTPKADAAAKGWTWKDHLNDLALVDAAGARIGPPVGAWVKYSDGGTSRVSARFNTDGGINTADIKAVGEVEKVWYVFAVPHGTQIAKVMSGQTVVSSQPLDVP